MTHGSRRVAAVGDSEPRIAARADRQVTAGACGGFITRMLVLLFALVALLVWLLFVRGRPVASRVQRGVLAGAVAVVAAALAVRAGPAATGATLVLAAVALALWLRLRGGGDDPGDDGPDPPDGPDPDPGPGRERELPRDVLDVDAFDRARAEWERELPRRD